MKTNRLFPVLVVFAALLVAGPATGTQVQPKKPNIVIIWGDDIGQSNISAYSHGVMGYRTPNIDRIAREGAMFTDYYAEQSCTAGRASFITGQSGLRTGMTKVGLPGATLGLQKEDPTIAELLKPLGYATGQFGKNHLGDRNEFLPTLLAVAGDTEVKDKLLKGYQVGGMTYKVHLDGDNLVPYLTGQAAKSPRESFFYVNDDQQLTALRYDNWKTVFMEQRAPGTLRVWAEPFTTLRVPKIFNLRTDPYERADITSNTYYDWLLDHAFLLVPAQDYVGKFLMTLKEYPQRQKAATFNLDEVMRTLREGQAK